MSIILDGTTGITTTAPITTANGGTGLSAAGTSGNVLTSDGTNWTSSAQTGLGYGQTWTDVTASRALVTSYTNSTGKPILVLVTVSGGSADNRFTATCNGVAIIRVQTVVSGAGYNANLSFVVPNSGTYSVTQSGTGGSISLWTELR